MSVLVFDLDGTLVDTIADLTATLNAVLTGAGHPAVPVETMRVAAGQGARVMLREGLALSGTRLAEEEIDPLYTAFLAHYEAHIADFSRPFPGAVAAIEALRAEGWRCAVCTNKLERLARPLLDALDLTRLFEAVVGGDTFQRAKPHAEPVLGAIARAGGAARGSVMIGDSATDINAARAAGLPVVAVDFGYTAIPVRDLGPDRIISHYDRLAEAVAAVSRGVAMGQN
ncbi:phosphoglycolate phosphatase [Polymorphum gilvum]|uniref:Phosphoglycolate phosphatase n=1 Tax=Polymorphum gilvum (strain LMG 25793 / CGMCC 1.9160 / SL003B-26A1) TaxID=991905 RepID=F2J5C3_POLGS|nr:phosphoglycolate phosphatase [Polymorphum gilvum]ADZ71182.1 Phosphoglycolate phosphatase, bacterial [Polymorphum gilvum SL003B-26A1]